MYIQYGSTGVAGTLLKTPVGESRSRHLWEGGRWLLLAEKLTVLTAAERQELQQPRGGEELLQPISVLGG